MSFDDILLQGHSTFDLMELARKPASASAICFYRLSDIAFPQKKISLSSSVTISDRSHLRTSIGRLMAGLEPKDKKVANAACNAYTIRRAEFGGVHNGIVVPSNATHYVEIYKRMACDENPYAFPNSLPEISKCIDTAIYLAAPRNLHIPGKITALARRGAYFSISITPEKYSTSFLNSEATSVSQNTVDSTLLRKLFCRITSENLEKNVGLAMRRFLQAIHREQREDMIIDLVIALEALYSTSNRTTKERIGLRAAFELEGDRCETFQTFNDVYRVRNRIAHGADVDNVELDRIASMGIKLTKLCLKQALLSGVPRHKALSALDERILSV